MNTVDRLRELARNLYWTWHPRVIGILRDIDRELWREMNHNPVAFLDRLSREVVAARAADLALGARITQAFHRLRSYLARTDTWGAEHGGILHAQPVAYFSAEFGLHESLPIYSGGLGVLAGDHLKAASDLGVPIVGVGLFYAKGYFDQHLDSDGWQHESYFAADLRTLPLDPATDPAGRPLLVPVETSAGKVWIQVWTAHVGCNRLLLLDTNVEENAPEDRTLTEQLYGGDERMRIRQELVLGVGGMKALSALGIRQSVTHLNEGHSAFAVLERARELIERDGRSFEEVQETTAAHTVFTTHTPMEAGHDRFESTLIEETLGPLRKQLGLSEAQLLALGRRDPSDATEKFCMTILGLKMSRSRNAVSALHGRVSRKMWNGLWPDLPEDRVPIGHITNGVHGASWIALPMAVLLSRYLQEDGGEETSGSRAWEAVDQIDEAEFWEQHEILRTNLVEFVRRRVCRQAEARGEAPPTRADGRPCLDPSVLTVGFARRFATYKRADLLFRDLDRLDHLVNHPEHPVQFIYSGKAHPRDEPGKRLLQQVVRHTCDPRFRGKIVFVENHDINVGRHLAQGVDLWLNTPRRPDEACGTSGQKIILNGGLNLSTLDGWWAQAYDGMNGFAIGEGAQHVDPGRQDELDLRALYEVLENQVVPLFYDRDPDGVPRRWVARQKHAIGTLARRFSARRMVKDYTLQCYLPAAGAPTSSS